MIGRVSESYRHIRAHPDRQRGFNVNGLRWGA